MKGLQKSEKDGIGWSSLGNEARNQGSLAMRTPKMTGGYGNLSGVPFDAKNTSIAKKNGFSAADKGATPVIRGQRDSSDDYLQEYVQRKGSEVRALDQKGVEGSEGFIFEEEKEGMSVQGFEGQDSEESDMEEKEIAFSKESNLEAQEEVEEDYNVENERKIERVAGNSDGKSNRREQQLAREKEKSGGLVRTEEKTESPMGKQGLEKVLGSRRALGDEDKKLSTQEKHLEPRKNSSKQARIEMTTDANQLEIHCKGKQGGICDSEVGRIDRASNLNSTSKANKTNPDHLINIGVGNSQDNSMAKITGDGARSSLQKGLLMRPKAIGNQAIAYNPFKKENHFRDRLPCLAIDNQKQAHLPAHIPNIGHRRSRLGQAEEFSENIVFSRAQLNSQDISDKYVYSRPPSRNEMLEGNHASRHGEKYTRPISGVQSLPRSNVSSLDKKVLGRFKDSARNSQSGSRLNESGLESQRLIALKEKYRGMDEKFESTSTSAYQNPATHSYTKRNELRDILARQNENFTSIHSKPQLGMKIKEGFLSRDINLKRQLKMERRKESEHSDRDFLPSLRSKLNIQMSNENSLGETSVLKAAERHETPLKLSYKNMVSKGVGKSSTSKKLTPAYISSFYKEKRTEHLSGQVTPVSRFRSIEDSPYSTSKLEFVTPYNLTKASGFGLSIQAPQKAVAMVEVLNENRKMDLAGLETVNQKGMKILKELSQYLTKQMEKASRQIFLAQSQGILAGTNGKAISRKNTFMALKCAKDHSTNALMIASLEKELERYTGTEQGNCDPGYEMSNEGMRRDSKRSAESWWSKLKSAEKK
jgi:hypothetical protein